MNFTDYQDQARKTAIYSPEYALIYPALGMTGEAGEVAEKVKKWLRDGNIDPDALHKEIGDVLWYLANICSDMQEEFNHVYSLENAANGNIKKLQSRMKRGVIVGSGDER